MTTALRLTTAPKSASTFSRFFTKTGAAFVTAAATEKNDQKGKVRLVRNSDIITGAVFVTAAATEKIG